MVQALTDNPRVVGNKMMEHLVTACLIFVALCFSSPCNSQEKYTFGVGGDSCVSYVSHVTISPGKLVSRTAPDAGRIYNRRYISNGCLGSSVVTMPR
jgi:hypothetical protein